MIDAITLKRAEEAGLPAAESHPDSPLACYPMRFEWEIAEGRLVQKCTQRNCTVCAGPPRTVPLDTAWPAPERAMEEVTVSRPSMEEVKALAEAHGWSTRITFARGCWPSVGGRPSRQRDSYALRMWRGQERAVAVYVEGVFEGKTWGWDTLLSWTLDTFPATVASIGRFQDTVFGPLCKPSWPGPKDWSCPHFGPVHGPVKPPAVRSKRAMVSDGSENATPLW